ITVAATPAPAPQSTVAPLAPEPERAGVGRLPPPLHVIEGAHAAPTDRFVVPPGDAQVTIAPAPRKTNEIRLTAISQRDGRPVAVINDRMLFEGDSFDGIQLLRVGESEVEVEIGGRRQVVKF